MTDVALRDYLEGKIADLSTRVFDRFEQMDRATEASRRAYEQERAREREAIAEARAQIDKHFSNLNEWERTFRSMSSDYIKRSEVEAILSGVLDRITKLEKWQERQTGKGQQTGLLFGATIALVSIGLVIISKLAS